ncbi:hypothetical protein [Chelatococcus sp.]|uniref:hypothetical protein n=1 Tax=Chelatococcus sp. TaxID=1953771 RepID=UPI001EBAF1D4|nr:hypothetical protein [Chelatococcus sp.]MBX3543748.1 hypothetical protein [Chelatococcus sp.]CAH1677798.1 hypothetical protein CHELA41_24445 [Hyphomicrobiales bacterium]
MALPGGPDPNSGSIVTSIGAVATGMLNIVTGIQNAVIGINKLGRTIEAVFPQQAGGTSTSASAGAASALPSTPQGYLTIVVDGNAVKVPYYL